MALNNNCPECDHINLITAKFCSECGYNLSTDSKSLKLNSCEKCGKENNNDSRFCNSCGEGLNRQRSQKKDKPRKLISKKQGHVKVQLTSSFVKYPLVLVIGALTLLFIIININDEEIVNRKSNSIQPTSQDFSLERDVLIIASKFACSCGSCGEEALETCKCGTAEQERNFIRKELQSGKSISQVIAAVNKRYGHLKSETAGKFKGSGFNLDLSGQKQNEIFSKITPPKPVIYNTIATDQDRDKIFSHFECPCGQCGIPELQDCSCQHPKGATEVKLFVDIKIEDGKYTIAEVIDIVDQKYGHKIR